MTFASAPGKLVLLGDYAVTEGAPALVAAVDRRAEAVVDPGAPGSAVVDAVLEEARAAGFDPPPGVRVDTLRFHRPSGEKLGLGSSAAVAVVTAALATGRGDEACFEVALEGHRRAAGGTGSGIDVAACFHGGVIATRRQPAPVEALPSRIPGLCLSVLYANQSASTAELLRACRTAPRWPAWMAAMTPIAEEGIAAWRSGQRDAFVSVVARYGWAMADLGQDAGAPVVTETIEAIMRAAEAEGGAAKPSGAGGGDVVLVVGADPELGTRVAKTAGAVLVDAGVDRVGLRRGPAPEERA